MEIIRQIYKHSSATLYATIVNIAVVAFVFRNIIDPRINYTWATICIVYLCLRLLLTKYVVWKGIREENVKRRFWQFAITIFISGICVGSSGIIYISPEWPAYNAFIFFLMGGTFAGAVGGFAIKRTVVFVFATPVMLPVTIHSFLLGGELNTVMGLLGTVFIIMMIILVNRMNYSLLVSFRLGIENKMLAEKTVELNLDLKKANENLSNLTYYDPLTNIVNRRYIFDVFKNELDRFSVAKKGSLLSSKREGNIALQVYGIFIVDIDHFKRVNDTWGHKSGDDVLVQFVEIIKGLMRKDDILARWGGEEFVIILKRTEAQYVQIFANRIIETVAAAKFNIGSSSIIQKTCSVGYTLYPFVPEFPSALSLFETIEIADHALYFAKRNGRNRAVSANYISSAKKMNEPKDANAIVKDLNAAIDEGTLVLK